MVLNTRREFLKKGAGLVVASAFGAPAIIKAQGATPRKVRRNASTMVPTDPFFIDYAEAVKALHDFSLPDGNNGWRNQALIHLKFCPHGEDDFCAWHRHYISVFETICGELIGKPDFALAYWDWTSNNGRLPSPFFLDGPLNVEYWGDPSDATAPNWANGWHVNTSGTRGITEVIGLQSDPVRGGSFTSENINRILRSSQFKIFQGRLEGSPHNNGHVVTGSGDGHMGDGMSPLDPAFWLHHCNIDRIWAEWQFAGNGTPDIVKDYSGQFVGTNGGVLSGNFTANSARNLASMNVTYDTLPVLDPAQDMRVSMLQSALDSSDIRGISSKVIIKPQVIGASGGLLAARTFIPADLTIEVDDFVSAVFSPRAFLSPQTSNRNTAAIEDSRILARLSGIKGRGDVSKIIFNVFINCPYLSPETPSNDPYYADTFSFFMPLTDHHEAEVIVDITEPLRKQAGEGRIDTSDIKVQLMPIPSSIDVDLSEETSISVSSIEIIQS